VRIAGICQAFFLPNSEKKLFLLPIVCIVSAFLSRALCWIGIAGSEGLLKEGLVGCGLVTLTLVLELFRVRSDRSFGLTDLLRLLVLPIAVSGLLSSSEFLLKASISPNIVLPFVARYSSPTPTKRTMPRSRATPSESVKKLCRRAALRLFVVGWIAEGRAVMVRR